MPRRIAIPAQAAKIGFLMPTARPLFCVLAATLVIAATGLRAELATWTNLDGVTMSAEFLARKGDYVSFRKADGSKYLYPYAKLTAEDRARVDDLARPASEAAAAAEAEAARKAAAATPASAAPAVKTPAQPAGEIAGALAGKLVTVKGGSLASAPADRLNGARYLAFYYSAHWCPPCRAFTPELVDTYKAIKAKHPEFELVFVSSDRDEGAMKGYMTEYNMDWPALRFGEKKSIRAVRRPGHESGIPNLVFMDASGKELSLSFTPDGDYRGPRAVLADIKKHFRM